MSGEKTTRFHVWCPSGGETADDGVTVTAGSPEEAAAQRHLDVREDAGLDDEWCVYIVCNPRLGTDAKVSVRSTVEVHCYTRTDGESDTPSSDLNDGTAGAEP